MNCSSCHKGIAVITYPGLVEMEYYPKWTLEIIDMYVDDEISEEEFFSTMKYLVEERIIRIGR